MNCLSYREAILISSALIAGSQVPLPTYKDAIQTEPTLYMLTIRPLYDAGNAGVPIRFAEPLKIEQLDWSVIEALETHLRLRTFAEDWDFPGMEVYDDL